MQITVKAARVNAGFKRQPIAEALGLSIGGYSKKENGSSKFYVDEIAVLSKMFNVPFENFFEAECLIKTH